jgi:hypothetical protein
MPAMPLVSNSCSGFCASAFAGPPDQDESADQEHQPAKISTGIRGRGPIRPPSITATTVCTGKAAHLDPDRQRLVSRGRDQGRDEGLVMQFDGENQQEGGGGNGEAQVMTRLTIRRGPAPASPACR